MPLAPLSLSHMATWPSSTGAGDGIGISIWTALEMPAPHRSLLHSLDGRLVESSAIGELDGQMPVSAPALLPPVTRRVESRKQSHGSATDRTKGKGYALSIHLLLSRTTSVAGFCVRSGSLDDRNGCACTVLAGNM